MNALFWISLIMPQFALPNSDRSNAPPPDDWVAFGAPSLFTAIDDPVAGHDGGVTFAEALEPQDHVFSVNLQSLTDPEVHTGHIIHLWARRVDPIESASLRITLRQGLTTIATREFLDLSTPYLLRQVVLTTIEAALITEYGDLNVEMKALASNSLGAIRLTQIYLEVPIPPTSSSVIARATASAKCVRIRNTAVVFSSAVALGSGLTTRIRHHDASAVAIAAAASGSVAVKAGAAAVAAIAGASTPIPEVCRWDVAVGAAQFARPLADVFVDSWINELGSASNLALSIDEARADDNTTFIESSIWNPFAKVYDVALPPVADPLQDINHSIVVRAKKVWSGNPSNIVQLFARLLDPVTGSVIHAAGVELKTGYTSFVIRVPTNSASTIQGYGSLRLQLFALSGVDDPDSLVKPRVTQLYLRVPAVALKRLVRGLAIAGAQATPGRVRGVSSNVNCVATAVARATRIQSESDSSTVVARSSSTADARRLRGMTATATAIANGTATATRVSVLVSSTVTAIATASAKCARIRPATSAVVAVAIGAAFVDDEPPAPPTGACCLPDGSCLDGQTVDQCAAAGGTYQGNSTTCAAANCPPPAEEPEQCAIKMIPYREPVHPYKRRMAALLKDGRIAICVPTRSAQYGRRRTWVGAQRSDGQMGEGSPALDRMIVGHAVRDDEHPMRRFAIAKAECERGEEACRRCEDDLPRVVPVCVWTPALRDLGLDDTVRLVSFRCARRTLPPFYLEETDIEGRFRRVFPDHPLLTSFVEFCSGSSLPAIGPNTLYEVCRLFDYAASSSSHPGLFELEEWQFSGGSFAGYWLVMSDFFPTFGSTLCNRWVTSQDWPFGASAPTGFVFTAITRPFPPRVFDLKALEKC